MSYSFKALVWARKVGISCTIDSARILHNKYLCSRHFSENVFTTAERIHFDRVAVSCGSDSASQSLLPLSVPSLHTLCFDPLLSVITPTDHIHVVPPTINKKSLVPSSVTSIPNHENIPSTINKKTLMPSSVTSIPTHTAIPPTSFQMSTVHSSPRAANIFTVKETSFPLSSANITAAYE
jgi:hypothetical protein